MRLHFSKPQHEISVAKFESEFELILFKGEVTLFLSDINVLSTSGIRTLKIHHFM